MRARRAILYVPGDDLHKITKAAALGVDCICLDMEDGVGLNRKVEARATIVSALQTLDFRQVEKLTRINPVGSGLENEDLDAVLPAHPEGIVIPKVESADQVRWVSGQIAEAEKRFGWSSGSIGLIAQIETAMGVVNLREIASSNGRLQALIFGAEDLAGDIGAVRTRPGWEVFYARGAVVTYASAYNLQAIDMVYVDLHDIEGLVSESIQGAQMGYSGKQIIHPNQVSPVLQAFTPSAEAVDYAKKLLQAYLECQQSGRGVFAYQGKMVDAPVIKAAQQVLVRAEAAGKI
jgi:citrate lyase beta subunit